MQNMRKNCPLRTWAVRDEIIPRLRYIAPEVVPRGESYFGEQMHAI